MLTDREFQDSQHKRDLWIGMTWAAIVPVLIATVYVLSSSGKYGVPLAGATLLVGIPVSLVSTFIALPFVRDLRRSGNLSGIFVLPLSMAVGAVTFGFAYSWSGPNSKFWVGMLLGAGLGLSAGISLCVGSGISFSNRSRNG